MNIKGVQCVMGINKYGIKLSDFNNYKDYLKAYVKAKNFFYKKTKQGKITHLKAVNKYKNSILGKGTHRSNYAKRRVALLKRIVPWTNLKTIKEFYKNCPIGYNVDHIVPLQGVNVSGLHVLNNLQYLTMSQNLSKGNKYGY